MSDFLTRITRLTRGESTAVKPRLPGHFTPLPDTQPATQPDDTTLAHGANGQGMEPDHSASRPAPEPGTAAAVARAISHETQTRALRADSTDAFVHAPIAARREGVNKAISTPAHDGMPPSPETDENPAARRILPGMDGTDGVSGFAGDTDTQPGPLQPVNEGDPVSPGENSRATPARVAPELPKLLVRTHPAGQEETGLLDLPSIPESPQRAQSEPVVHINIGHIEVRANTSASAQPRAAKPQPQSSLTLQDYLARGQTGGKRS